MSDDESRHAPPQSAGGPNFSENGSGAIENDQTGSSPSMAALLSQMQATFAAQIEQLRRDQAAPRAEAAETELAAARGSTQGPAGTVFPPNTPTLSSTGSYGDSTARSRKDNLYKDLQRINWIADAPHTMRDMLVPCLVDNGFA